MPELPEVETTRRGIEPHIVGQTIARFVVRQRELRWPVPAHLDKTLPGQTIQRVERRGKYLLLRTAGGTLLLHLGMSGSLRMVGSEVPPRRHDHVDLIFTRGDCLRFHDPRRFGCCLWSSDDPLLHPLLVDMGPEPLDAEFSGDALYQVSRGRKAAVKTFIMDSRMVVGVGNIYANEALFRAGIHPARAAGKVSLLRYRELVHVIRAVLEAAIAQGGTTLRDFVNEAGKPGYFQQTLAVYDREGQPCVRCASTIRSIRLGQRSSFFCPRCQR